VWLADYDNEIYSDALMVVDIDDSEEVQPAETKPQLNHVYSKVNGDLENDLDASVAMNQRMPVGANTVRRQSSVSGATVSPVNGLKTHEHNIILQRMAIVEVKKPGKGNVCYGCENNT